ncbi:MAG: NAD(P)-binding protein, partial [Chthoniobacterales bacterium]
MKADKHGSSQFHMERLSRPITELQRNSFEVVVIGSGYGGSIAASRMARAGKSVCLLERGREIHPGEYPKTKRHALKEMQVDTQKAHLGS